jgi:drug/metabolite transporter (DMT)-like permease
MSPARKRAYLELLVVAIIWGSASPVIKYTLSGFSPAIFLTYRFFISTIIAIIIFVFIKVKIPKNPKVMGIILLNGFLISTVTLGLLFLGTDKTSSIESNLISAMSPVIIAVAGVFFLKERITKRESLGILIALAGTLITIIEPILNFSQGFEGLTGNLLVLASVIVGAATAILAKVALRDEADALFATNISFVVGFLTLIPFTLRQILNSDFQVITSVPFGYHLGVFYMAILSGTLAYFLWHKAEKTIEVGEVNLIAYLYPVFGAPLSILWLKEKIDTPFIIGGIIIVIGVALAQWKKRSYN